MKTAFWAAILAALTALPAAAAEPPSDATSDRYTREPAPDRNDQQAQSRERERRSGEIETLRRDHMSSPNVKGQQVPEDTSTGAAAPEQRGQSKQTEGGIRP
ncbi:MAG: hypothetical protein ACM31D_07835 [Bacteroidota bacterium]